MWLWVQTPTTAMVASDVAFLPAWWVCRHGNRACVVGYAYVAFYSMWWVLRMWQST